VTAAEAADPSKETIIKIRDAFSKAHDVVRDGMRKSPVKSLGEPR